MNWIEKKIGDNSVIVRQVDFDELDLPEIVYKYRNWHDKNHRTILTNQEVYFASPATFQKGDNPDPFDCKIPVRYDLLNDEQIVQLYFHNSPKIQGHEHWTWKQDLEFAINCKNKTPIKNKGYFEQWEKEYFDDFNERFGVLSLTAEPENIKMWENYSNNHQGFCVGFDPKISFRFFGGGGKVDYDNDSLPLILPEPFMDWELQKNLHIFSKLRKWTFEKEYRTHRFREQPMSRKDRVQKLPPECFKEIIFGAKIATEHKEQILEIIKKNLSHIQVKQVSLQGDTILIN